MTESSLDDAHRPVSHSDDYPLGNSESEIEHLTAQAESCAGSARSLLDRIPIRGDWHAIDVGCGVLGILHLLAERIGPDGVVLGLDRENRMLDAARRNLDGLDLQRVRLDQVTLPSSDLPEGTADLVHARMLLVNVAGADAFVGLMAGLARAGGVVALQEPDCAAWMCHPTHPAFERLRELFCDNYVRRGRDPRIGPRLPELLQAAGLRMTSVDVVAMWVTTPGVWAHTQLPSFAEQIRESLIEHGQCGNDELDDLIAEAREHLAQPGTLTYCPLWQVIGERPAVSA